MRLSCLCLAACLLLPVPAFAADHIIVQKARAFRPAEITIDRGDRLTVTNDDEFIHQIYTAGDTFSFDSEEKSPGENLNESFPRVGTFPVRCHIHPTMRMTIIVK